MIIGKYKRYFVPGEEKYETLREAMIAAYYACEYNTAYFYEIIDGSKIYSREDIEKYWKDNNFYETML